jgi:hypothetical protein
VDLIIFLTLTRLVVVIIFENFSFALFTRPLGDYQWRRGPKISRERCRPASSYFDLKPNTSLIKSNTEV